jgi:hypothetical protein
VVSRLQVGIAVFDLRPLGHPLEQAPSFSSVSDWATKSMKVWWTSKGGTAVPMRLTCAMAMMVSSWWVALRSLKLRTTTEAFVPGCGPMSQLAPADP